MRGTERCEPKQTGSGQKKGQPMMKGIQSDHERGQVRSTKQQGNGRSTPKCGNESASKNREQKLQALQ
jgi:hypothetical protein